VQAVAGSLLWMFVLPALVALVSVLLFAVILPDRRLDPKLPLASYSLGSFLGSFWVNPRRYPDFGWVWLGRFLVFLGMATLTSYQVYYLLDHLHVSPQAVAGLIFLSTLISNMTIIVAGNLSGWCSDKVGRRKPFVLLSALLSTLGLLVIALAPSITTFLITMAMIGIGQGVYHAIDLALGAAVLPEGGRQAGKDMGVFGIVGSLSYTIATAMAPLFLAIGGGAIMWPSSWPQLSSPWWVPSAFNPSKASADGLRGRARRWEPEAVPAAACCPFGVRSLSQALRGKSVLSQP
jgi:predicted MFS family arabinose efflux permease